MRTNHKEQKKPVAGFRRREAVPTPTVAGWNRFVLLTDFRTHTRLKNGQKLKTNSPSFSFIHWLALYWKKVFVWVEVAVARVYSRRATAARIEEGGSGDHGQLNTCDMKMGPTSPHMPNRTIYG